MTAMLHKNALVEPGAKIGNGTKIWAFVHILPGASIGKNCNICDGVFIENHVKIGDRVTIKCGVQVWDGITIENDVFIGPNATFTNDPFPRSKKYQNSVVKTLIKEGASIGANATILPGISIGKNAMIGAGAVVLKSVPPNAIVVGNPARIVGYANTEKYVEQSPTVDKNKHLAIGRKSIVTGVKLFSFPVFNDIRGSLSVGDFSSNVPFKPKRFFTVYNVPSKETRGEHAHKKCKQFLICLYGSVQIFVDDGRNRQEFHLDKPSLGLYIPGGIWATQFNYSDNAVLLVFASESYHADDYIRDYDEYLMYVNI
jgi:UDP-2-acetamido-3-amino-2,3-dideoxy-glucuronate N-acetyltransferase